MSELTPDEKALARAIDCIVRIDPKRIERAQAGDSDSANVGIPWGRFLNLIEAIEKARPGWIERTRALMVEQGTGTPWKRKNGRKQP